MSGAGHLRALTRRYGFRYLPCRFGVEIHLPGERRVSPKSRVEPALLALVCGKPEA